MACAELQRLPTLRVLPFCPEQFGMGTPRTMPDTHGGDGFDVLAGRAKVIDEHRRDLTEQMLTGALGLLRARLEAGYTPPADALGHHDHPWVLEHLPGVHPRA